MNSRFTSARRIVVKIGSALLVDFDSGRLRRTWLEALADDIEMCRQRGQQVIVVSSGAIALGRSMLGLPPRTLRLDESQAAAATGQVALAHAYSRALKERDIEAAQILLTLDDTEERRRYINARNTITTLLSLGAVPVINENDTVATSEIRYGDNDRLAARVAEMASADCLVLLSDVDGFYTADPSLGTGGTRIPEIRTITPEIRAMAGDAGTSLSRGGMITKLEAARVAQQAGADMVITSGKVLRPLSALEQGAGSTWFISRDEPLTARKKWIAGRLEPSGALVVDDGAIRAMEQGKSLLPAGVHRIEGAFDKGDAVQVLDRRGREICRGLVAYNHEDAARIAGHNSREIEAILGYSGRPEIIHRDDMALTKG